MNKRTKQTEYLAGMTGRNVLCWQLVTINTRESSGERRRVFVIGRLYAKIRERGNEPSEVRAGLGIWQIIHIWYFSPFLSSRICGENINIVNAMQPGRPVKRYFHFAIVPDVMWDDWHLKCIILQDRNLHDDTVTQSQPDAAIGLGYLLHSHWSRANDTSSGHPKFLAYYRSFLCMEAILMP